MQDNEQFKDNNSNNFILDLTVMTIFSTLFKERKIELYGLFLSTLH